MDLKKLNCTACGAPISVPDELDYINCAACGSFFSIERGEGYIGLKVAQKITKAIEDTGRGTQDVIREGTQVTRAELQRLQVTQEISMAEMKLGNLQAEIRGVQRAGTTPSAVSQMSSLRGLEYYSMEQIRSLRIRAAALGSQDPQTRLKNAEQEIEWLETEKTSLVNSNYSQVQKRELAAKLAQRSRALKQEAHDLRIYLIKRELPSFKINPLPLDTLEQTASFLKQANEDRQELDSSIHPWNAELKEVQNELANRYNTVHQAWANLENQRVDGLVRTRTPSSAAGDMASLQEQLAYVSNALDQLSRQPSNEVIQERISRLRIEKSQIEKALLKSQKEHEKALRRAQKEQQRALQHERQGSAAPKTSLLQVLIVFVGGVLSGLAVLWGSITSRARNTAEPLAAAGASISQFNPTAVHSMGEYKEPGPAQAGSTSKFEIVQAGIGSLLALGILIVFLAIAFVISETLFGDLPGTNYVDTGLSVLILAIGFTFGGFVQLRYVASSMLIRGLWGFRGLPIGRAGHGTQNLTAIRWFVGTWLLMGVFLMLLGVAMMLPSILSAGMLMLSLVLAPAVAIISALRTERKLY